jgi:hypothetical protein
MKKLKWYSWLGLVVSLILFIILFQHSVTTFGEDAGFAFAPMLLILGLPMIIIAGLSTIPIWRR